MSREGLDPMLDTIAEQIADMDGLTWHILTTAESAKYLAAAAEVQYALGGYLIPADTDLAEIKQQTADLATWDEIKESLTELSTFIGEALEPTPGQAKRYREQLLQVQLRLDGLLKRAEDI